MLVTSLKNMTKLSEKTIKERNRRIEIETAIDAIKAELKAIEQVLKTMK